MLIKLRAKYTKRADVKRNPYKARTGNSHGPNKNRKGRKLWGTGKR